MVKKKKKTRNNFKNFLRENILILIVFLTFLLISSLIPLLTKNTSNKISKIDNKNSIANYASPSALASPSISPMPTPTPSPVYAGYCLRVPVLMYHHIQPESVALQLGQKALTVDNGIFDSQMQYLSQNGYTALFANELALALINKQPLPARSVVITMDDGYEDNYIYALPILQKYGIKANIMLSTGLMGNSNMLSWDEVKNLKSSGLIYFTNHTWSHYPVTKPPQEKIESEIDLATTQIKQYAGQDVSMFTYPYGALNDNAIGTLQRKGFLGAFSEIPGQYQCDSFLMTLHRTRIGNAPLSSYGI